MLKLVGFGNALVDKVIQANDAYIGSLGMEKGYMTLIKEPLHLPRHLPVETLAGGSLTNTLVGLAMLGEKVGFIGRIAEDEEGTLFEEDLRRNGVNFLTPQRSTSAATGCCHIIVTPDGARTMLSYHGCCNEIVVTPELLALVEHVPWLLFEGYLWEHPHFHAKALQLATCVKQQIVLTLGDYYCVQRNRAKFLAFIEATQAILFGNEDEFIALFASKDSEKLRQKAARLTPLAVITLGKKGALVVEHGNLHYIPCAPVQVVDTTGAGDFFTSGFLYGILNNWAVHQTGAFAHACAQVTLQTLGARPQFLPRPSLIK